MSDAKRKKATSRDARRPPRPDVNRHRLRGQASLLELAHDAIFDCALDGTILYWNHGAETMYGWTKKEAVGRISHEFLHSRFDVPIEGIVQTIIRTGRWEGEFSQIDRWGKTLQTAGRWALKVDKQGRPAGILKINVDITERKKAEEALRAAYLYTRSLIEASLDPLVTIGLDGKITDVNKATETITGYSRQDLIGRDFSDFFTDPAKAREGYQKVFEKGLVRDYELTVRNLQGGLTEVLYNAAVYRDESGRIQGVFAAARDVTDRKKAEAETLRLVKALEQTDEGILILDRDREILYVNPAFERISGLRAEDTLRSTYDDILRKMGREEDLEKTIEETLLRRDRWNGHMARRRPDGHENALDVSISPVVDESGRLMNFVVVERDVTEDVRLRDHVRQRQKMEALGTLAGGIAHDFNNILMPIMINAEMALSEEPEGSEKARALRLVIEAARRGKDLVKQIITFSRRREHEKSPLAVGPILKESLKFLRASLPANIEIIDGIEADQAMALADATQIHQVLMNLCNNAAYAMREGGGVLEVRLTEIEIGPREAPPGAGLQPGSYIRLTVGDTGHGMTPEIMEKVFDPFFTTKPQGEGTGMGLAVVHGIVENHGGVVRVASEPGKGSRFDVYIPSIHGRPEAPVEAWPAAAGGTGSILFVDDEEINVQTIAPMLERLGYGVVGQTDPLEALEAFRRRPGEFDLVITDQMMPRLTGERLIAELLRLRPDVPIILTTGFSETIDEERAKSMGARGLLMKPYTIREIADKIRVVLPAKH